MWAIARFDLHLTAAEFYGLTPFQFNLLAKRLLAEREHRELIAGYTTAAVINHAMHPPEEPVSAKDFMPSACDESGKVPEAELSEEELERQSAFNLEVLIAAEKMRARAAARQTQDA